MDVETLDGQCAEGEVLAVVFGVHEWARLVTLAAVRPVLALDHLLLRGHGHRVYPLSDVVLVRRQVDHTRRQQGLRLGRGVLDEGRLVRLPVARDDRRPTGVLLSRLLVVLL